MQYGILINEGNNKRIYIVDQIKDQQIFDLVSYIQKTLHQPRALIDEELIEFAENDLGAKLNLVKLVAEINISKPLQDW